MKRLFKHLKKSRRGMSLIETVAALIIFSLAVVVMGRITAVKIEEQASVDSQYIMIKLDAFLSDIYHQYHLATDVAVTENAQGGTLLTIGLGNDGTYIVDFIPGDLNTKGKIFINGEEAFDAEDFQASSTGNNLYVAVKANGDRMLEMDIYK